MKIASCGSFESNDCFITVKESKTLNIKIESIVFDQFGDQIKDVILTTLKELSIDQLDIFIEDKGALDYTIKARLLTAINRLENKDA
jgi:citrate lyase subunit gamma (acyl carrier protein)